MTEQEMEQLMQRLSAGREYRLMQSFSVRSNSNDDSGMIADGYATTFNQPYLLYDFGDYKVYEQIDSRAFDDCDMSDVIMQYDHRGRVFARTSNKTLELNPDNIGLYFRADLSGTTIGNQLYEEINGGYTTKMSFGFVVGEQKSEYVEDKEAWDLADEPKDNMTIYRITKNIPHAEETDLDLVLWQVRRYGPFYVTGRYWEC